MMTTGPVLGTSTHREEVWRIAKEIGFIKEEKHLKIPLHAKVDGLRLQIHTPTYLRGIEGVVTEMEFDDLTGRFPNNPQAADILKQLYGKIPDLRYLKSSYLEVPILSGPVSELLEILR